MGYSGRLSRRFGEKPSQLHYMHFKKTTVSLCPIFIDFSVYSFWRQHPHWKLSNFCQLSVIQPTCADMRWRMMLPGAVGTNWPWKTFLQVGRRWAVGLSLLPYQYIPNWQSKERECEKVGFFRHGERYLRYEKQELRPGMEQQGELWVRGGSRGCLDPGSYRNN